MIAPAPQRPLVVACGALVSELRAVLAANGLSDHVDVRYLPANLHNTPKRIVAELAPVVDAALADGRPVLVGYADCGTGGHLDAFVDERPGVTRLPGAHCYEFFAGAADFAALQDEALGTFYLTEFLAKHFDALIWGTLGLDRHPELRDMYFANYTRVMFLSQTDDATVVELARQAAERLGLAFEHRHVGLDGLARPVGEWAQAVSLTARGASR